MSSPVFYDTHAHLDFPEFANEAEEIVARAESAGITRIINIGTTLESSRKAVEISQRFPNVYAAVGWHPSYVTSAPNDLPPEFGDLASHPKVVAIGEAGLDFSRLPSANGDTADDDALYKSRQANLFRQQLDLAATLGLNVIIHQRDSFNEVLQILKPFTPKTRAVFHCFVGTPADQQRVAALNCLVSFTGIVTFKNAPIVRETVRACALDAFMLETDCPFLAPVPFRGKRCEPAHVRPIAEHIAREKNCTLQDLSTHTCQTAHTFFPKLR
jgi:TatD DNase family protein